MKRFPLLVLAALLTIALAGAKQVSKSVKVVPKSGPLQGQTVYTDSYALFIGIGSYQNPQIPQIKSAPNDAKTMRDLLVTKFGFNPDPGHTVVLTDSEATYDRIRKELDRLADPKRVKKTDRVFVFFSGHGASVKDADGDSSGYLIPYDAQVDLNDLNNASTYEDSCIDMQDLVKRLGRSDANHRAVVLDACFSGLAVAKDFPAASSFDADTVKEDLAARGLYVLTGGTGTQQTFGVDDANGLSVFTRALVETLTDCAVHGRAAFVDTVAAEAAARTAALTQSRQLPVSLPKLGSGSMIFFPVTAAVAAVASAGGVKQLATEAVLSVTVTPSDATIEVDGRIVGAQLAVETDSSGKKSVVVNVSKPGFKAARFQVDMTAGQTSLLPVTLEALAGGAASTARLGIGSTKRSDKGDIDMVYVPAGEFTMGSDSADMKPVRKVTLDAYWIGKNDVTVGEFKAYCADRGIDFSTFPVPSWGWKNDNPMVNVSYDDAESFCKWAGGDLPTEAQWEKAARGEDGRVYPWGNDWDPSKLWWNQPLQGGSTAPVGSFPGGKSPYGCLDMAGNVWQWCLDWYGPYDATVTKNPTGAGFATNRVLRGGSWGINYPGGFRCANRSYGGPAYRDNSIGFRLAGRP